MSFSHMATASFASVFSYQAIVSSSKDADSASTSPSPSTSIAKTENADSCLC